MEVIGGRGNCEMSSALDRAAGLPELSTRTGGSWIFVGVLPWPAIYPESSRMARMMEGLRCCRHFAWALDTSGTPGTDFVDRLNQARPVSPEGLFISLRFEDTGNRVILAIHLPFSPGDVAVMAVIPDSGDESEKIAECLHGDDGTGNRINLWAGVPEKHLQRFPDTLAQIGQQFPFVVEVSAQELRDAKDEMPARHLLVVIQAQPFPECHNRC